MSHIAFVKHHKEFPFLVQISAMGTTITRLGSNGGVILVSLSGAPEPKEMDEMIAMGVPLIDWRETPEENAVLMRRVPAPAKDARSLPFDDTTGAPREVVASMAKALGASVHNLNCEKLHPKMFRRLNDVDASLFFGECETVDEYRQNDGGTSKILKAFDQCEDSIALNDEQRESLEGKLKRYFEAGDFSSDEHLEAVHDLKMHEHLDALLSACWSLIKYQSLLLDVRQSDSKSEVNALRSVLCDHMNEQITIQRGLDIIEHKTQYDAIEKYSVILGGILGKLE